MATCIVIANGAASTLTAETLEQNAYTVLPTPIKLLKNLAMLENEAVSAVYRFNSTIGRTKRLVHNLKLQGKVNRSDVCWQYIASQIRYRTGVESDAVTAIKTRYQKLTPLLQEGGRNLTKVFAAMVDEGKKCHQMCDLEAFTFQLKNETSQVMAKGHSDCATKISSLAARLEQTQEQKREQLENARAIVKGFTQQALADISDPIAENENKKYKRRLDQDPQYNRDTNKTNRVRKDFYSEMINGESVVDLSKKPLKKKPKKKIVDMEKVTRSYLKKVEKKIVSLTKEENELEEAVKVMEETYSKLKEKYVNPEKTKDMMVADCHSSMVQQKHYFEKAGDHLTKEHAALVATAVKEQESIKEAQRKLDVRSHCREQILYLIGQSAPDHILEDMLIRHDRTSLEKKKIQHIPYLM
eukprot:g5115.t1